MENFDSLVTGADQEVDLVVDGTSYEVDCIIFATGFEVGTSYTRRAGYDVIGRGGRAPERQVERRAPDLPRYADQRPPNCFFMGNTQTALTVNFTHLLDEQPSTSPASSTRAPGPWRSSS